MKKKGNTFLGFVIAVVIVSMLLIFYSIYGGYTSDIKECKDYIDYGYFTEVKGNFWDSLNDRTICLIIMEDGTKLPLNDFKTMSIKNALVNLK